METRALPQPGLSVPGKHSIACTLPHAPKPVLFFNLMCSHRYNLPGEVIHSEGIQSELQILDLLLAHFWSLLLLFQA